MTREEAIKAISDMILDMEYPNGVYHEKFTEDESRKHLALYMAKKALLPVSREKVEKVWKGEWLRDFDTGESICGNCHHVVFPKDYVNGELPHFCEFCGEAKTDEAVQMVMERLEALR